MHKKHAKYLCVYIYGICVYIYIYTYIYIYIVVVLNMMSICKNQDQFKLSLTAETYVGFFQFDVQVVNSEHLKSTFSQMAWRLELCTKMGGCSHDSMIF